MSDFLGGLLSPLVTWLYNYFGVVVAVIPQATWDLDKGGDVKEPISQSAALLVINSSSLSVNIHEAGVRLRDGNELDLGFSNVTLPVEVRPRDRFALVIRSDSFRRLAAQRFEHVRYFYVEDALFRKYKAYMSRQLATNILQVRYLVKENGAPGKG